MKKKRLIIVFLPCAVFALCAASLLLSKYGLSVTNYTLTTTKLTAPLRIVQLSDLHNMQFGEGNVRLIEKVSAQQPDLIVTTGDMLMQDREDISVLLSLVEELAQIAPVYCSMGNHELEYERNFLGTDVAAELEKAGAHVLHFSWDDMELNGQAVRLGGLYGYVLPEERYNRHGEEQDFLRSFEETDAYKILLCHIPEGMLLWGGLDDWEVDLTLSGHVHGGVVRLPLIGGLYSQEEKWFPSFTAGIRTGVQGSGILSRGLGVSGSVPSFNNIPEIVLVDICSE